MDAWANGHSYTAATINEIVRCDCICRLLMPGMPSCAGGAGTAGRGSQGRRFAPGKAGRARTAEAPHEGLAGEKVALNDAFRNKKPQLRPHAVSVSMILSCVHQVGHLCASDHHMAARCAGAAAATAQPRGRPEGGGEGEGRRGAEARSGGARHQRAARAAAHGQHSAGIILARMQFSASRLAGSLKWRDHTCSGQCVYECHVVTSHAIAAGRHQDSRRWTP